jgi:hypothetical protein
MRRGDEMRKRIEPLISSRIVFESFGDLRPPKERAEGNHPKRDGYHIEDRQEERNKCMTAPVVVVPNRIYLFKESPGKNEADQKHTEAN